MKKYRVPVTISTIITKCVGVIECDSLEEYNKILTENIEQDKYDIHFSNYACNDFDMGDADIEEVTEHEFKYCKIKE